MIINKLKMGTIKGAYTAESVGAMTLEQVVIILNEQANEIRTQRLAVERYRENEMRCERIINDIKNLLK